MALLTMPEFLIAPPEYTVALFRIPPEDMLTAPPETATIFAIPPVRIHSFAFASESVTSLATPPEDTIRSPYFRTVILLTTPPLASR